MLRLEAFIEGFCIYNTNKQAMPTQGAPVTNIIHLENKNLFKNLNSLTSLLSTIYIRTSLG